MLSEPLAESLPKEINRVRGVQDEFKALRGMKNVIVEPQIAMMEADIQAGIAAASSGDAVAMLRAYEALKGWVVLRC
jgi:hypothetical protein